ncbi:hypothetical protein [Sphingobacterium psychroaquaticum]|uniref:Uncharacterized protein n=1 Tax=Sphingobacterium psychroaquaticum TaxID=561061 RepID=A0A1X7K4L7_9SPHI|nr:hypothetical protein [Sphingobacterium psychroaquaticum]SMG35750.1 hypothetical protein SAMN05660862_2542 [Sphingobacterium psychroaquaticum]
MENLTISKENAVKAFDQANTKGKDLLKNLFGEKVFVKNIMDVVIDLPSALKYNGKTQEQFNWETERDTPAQKAEKALEEIALALREGKPLRMDQRWYYPYFERNTGSSVSFSYYDYYYDYVLANVGARRSVDTAEKAVYMGKKFIEYYNLSLAPEAAK